MFDDEFERIPARPPRAGKLPGMRLGAAIPRSTLTLLIVFVAFFALVPLSIINADPRARLQLGPTGTAEGRVLSVSDVPGCRMSGGRRVVYVFTQETGREFRGANVICEDSPYYSAQVGDRIEIRYLKRDPAVNAVAGSDLESQPPIFVFGLFPLFFLLMLSPLYWPQLREVMRARRLYKEGALVKGNVVFVKKRNAGTWPGWPGNSAADVYVAHQTPSGARSETIVWCTNDWLVNQLLPGTVVHILLPTDGSARGALLEAFIR